MTIQANLIALWTEGANSVSRNSCSPFGHPERRSRLYLFDFRFFEALRFFELLRFFADFFGGTFLPSRRASDSPIAIACLRLLTLRPERPLLSVPDLRFFIARPTLADAFLEYFRAIVILPAGAK
jgi:hypothetical protein